MATTKSRATRAADRAAQDQRPETQPDPPDDNGGPSHDTREAEAQAQQPEAEAKPEPEPKPDGSPYATVEAVQVLMPYFRPSVQVVLPDGEVVERLECTHPYAHEHEKAAERCGRSLAAKRGLPIGPAK